MGICCSKEFNKIHEELKKIDNKFGERMDTMEKKMDANFHSLRVGTYPLQTKELKHISVFSDTSQEENIDQKRNYVWTVMKAKDEAQNKEIIIAVSCIHGAMGLYSLDENFVYINIPRELCFAGVKNVMIPNPNEFKKIGMDVIIVELSTLPKGIDFDKLVLYDPLILKRPEEDGVFRTGFECSPVFGRTSTGLITGESIVAKRRKDDVFYLSVQIRETESGDFGTVLFTAGQDQETGLFTNVHPFGVLHGHSGTNRRMCAAPLPALGSLHSFTPCCDDTVPSCIQIEDSEVNRPRTLEKLLDYDPESTFLFRLERCQENVSGLLIRKGDFDWAHHREFVRELQEKLRRARRQSVGHQNAESQDVEASDKIFSNGHNSS